MGNVACLAPKWTFELKELSKEEKQHLNCKTNKQKNKLLLKHLINYFPLKKKPSFRNSHPYNDSLQRRSVSWWLNYWNGHGQGSKSILQHDDRHDNDTKLIKMEGSYYKHTHTPTHTCRYTHHIFVNFK